MRIATSRGKVRGAPIVAAKVGSIVDVKGENMLQGMLRDN